MAGERLRHRPLRRCTRGKRVSPASSVRTRARALQRKPFYKSHRAGRRRRGSWTCVSGRNRSPSPANLCARRAAYGGQKGLGDAGGPTRWPVKDPATAPSACAPAEKGSPPPPPSTRADGPCRANLSTKATARGGGGGGLGHAFQAAIAPLLPPTVAPGALRMAGRRGWGMRAAQLDGR